MAKGSDLPDPGDPGRACAGLQIPATRRIEGHPRRGLHPNTLLSFLAPGLMPEF